MAGNPRHAGGMTSAMANLRKVDESIADQQRLETCTCCGIRRGHTISCDVGNGQAPCDDVLRNLWRQAGGSFHGPNIETGTMPEAKLLPFLRGLMVKR